jgi:hypothetical protein
MDADGRLPFTAPLGMNQAIKLEFRVRLRRPHGARQDHLCLLSFKRKLAIPEETESVQL